MLSRPNTALSQIHLQIMWSRLIAVVEEQAQTLVRTAFSTPVREAGDLSAGVFDRDGNMLAQAVTGTPGHVNSMAAAVKHFLAAFPLATMKAGDHYITNDPWLTCGHLHDLTVVSPTFLPPHPEPVGLFASTVHVVDIGGLGMGPDGRQVFEEGLAIPLMPLAREGRFNDDLMQILRANVREPLQVEGDVYALAACNDEGSRRLVDMMEEFGIANLDRLGEHIIETSRAATIEAIGRLTPGKYKNSLTMDGYDRPLTLAAEMTIAADNIHVDYTGTSPASPYGINVVMNYTLAYTAFGVKCLVAPEVPNNAGSLAPITASAPDGCLLNVKRPRAVAARHTVGHMLPDVVFGCLHQVMAGGVPAEGASSLWNPQIYGGADVQDELGAGTETEAQADMPAFSTVIFHCGGTGARPGKDGLDVTAFPSGVRTIPVEATESVAPVIFRRREFREGSGGAGRFRGGLGQIIELGGLGGTPVAMLCNFERINNPARGRDGGGRGAPGGVSLVSGKPIRSKGRQTVAGGDFIRLELPGGGGFGPPAERD
ncbi:MAG TPA: hydantoinase B/oxoprolinase family protein, partial [Stellaceae bacterium]|nr:hydantoinase B/oxoprolinase family protein [Stellaceae bacterium]